MYKIKIAFLAFLLSGFGLFAQTGTYQCIHFEEKLEKSPKENRVSVETFLLEVNFDDPVNPYVTWLMDAETNDPAEVTKTWNIKSKVSTVREADPQKLTTTYIANRVINGVESADLYYVYKTEDHNMHTLSIIIHDPKARSKLCFYDMVLR